MGEPIPQISWTFNGKPVDKLGDRFLLLNGNSHLVITNVLKSDIGELVCSASNVAGFETRSMDIRVTCKCLHASSQVNDSFTLIHTGFNTTVVYRFCYYFCM